ncbi:MAG: 2-phosphoglycerate kinase [Candidatus Latescibacteria bacterium]|nr:2-phosphoglycerate kinase [bacterium]MBD3423218.1 2-phosphoglycerate kinase [Candidatus Latescibacterota bacterium]
MIKMVYVIKHDKKFPFSRGILARSIANSGLSLEEAYQLVQETKDELEETGNEMILSTEIKDFVSRKLLERGYVKQNRYYLTRSAIKNSPKPLLILIGGGSGVGKSTLSSEVAHKLGITRVVNTDTIREIMRSIISKDLIPTLHQSSFDAWKSLKTPLVDNKQIYAFQQQVSLVSECVIAVIRRAIKEGLKMVINGVHIVPGFLKKSLVKEHGEYILQYVIDVPDVEQHKQNFYKREEGSSRDPERYIDNIDNIRWTHEYILNMAKRNDVKIIENVDFDKLLGMILDDIIDKLDGRL